MEKASTTREREEYSDDEDSTDPFEELGVEEVKKTASKMEAWNKVFERNESGFRKYWRKESLGNGPILYGVTK